MKAIVIGASGGLGKALCDALEEGGGSVFALSRRAGTIDLLQEDSIAEAAHLLIPKGPFDRIVVASGVLHGNGLVPERSLRELNDDRLVQSFRVNAIGPALVARYFLPLLAEDGVFAALSARVGSIADNRLGGWFGYRASKAALNQLIRTAAIELARSKPRAKCITLHPGTVDTDMSRPFQRNVPAEQLFTPQQSAAYLLRVMNDVSPEESGMCLDWSGSPIPF